MGTMYFGDILMIWYVILVHFGFADFASGDFECRFCYADFVMQISVDAYFEYQFTAHFVSVDSVSAAFHFSLTAIYKYD